MNDDEIPNLDWRLNNEWYTWRVYVVYTELGLFVEDIVVVMGVGIVPMNLNIQDIMR